MTVKIDRNSGANPRPLAEALVKDQQYPFQATLKHSHTFPLVVPSSGVTGVIPPNEPTQVRVRSFDQAWALVVDLAELATLAERATDESLEKPVPFAELAPASKTKSKNPRAAAAQADSDAQEAV
ncbi:MULTISPECIES: hypothetical protein [Pseudomonas]|uniref:hypothetical protein n=1 Tax=Pseudomonas TaxID=286 RepID=UPI0012E242E1|nr:MULTISPECIES: hypothetical protein [Pseudomonas]MDG9809415.1 hypothetical protein [Pseudomonas juntendi]MDG9815772.1 hypothetical protein [Pseudomonas putida]